MKTKKKGCAGGCDIQARGINYRIAVSTGRRHHPPLKVCSRADDDADHQHLARRPPGAPQRQLLRRASRHRRPQRRGKSTLLEMLAGRLSPCSPTRSSWTAPPPPPPPPPTSAKSPGTDVTQRDVLFPLLTVRETLLFSVRLRLGASLPANDTDARVDALLDESSLRPFAASPAPGSRTSPPLRWRVFIGVEAVHDLAVLTLEDRTSGLDTASALQIVGAMAETRWHTAVLSIHQPGALIVKMFDAILLLASGTVDQLRAPARGSSCPPNVDAVEFFPR